MIDDRALYRLAGFAAVAGGLLRIGTSFLVWDSTLVWQEALADGIDVLLLFGFMGIYLARRTALGWAGLAAFVLAATGIASIIGPDTVAFGIDTYQSGVTMISIGLTALAAVMLFARTGSAAAAICWIMSLAVGVAGQAAGQASFGFFLGGILFGLGFVAAGIGLAMPATAAK